MEFIPEEIDGDMMVLRADGGLDATNAAAFIKEVEAIAGGGINRLIIDCSNLTHISSVGLGALIRLHARVAKQGGEVKLCGVSGVVMQVLSMMRLDRVFGMYPDIDQARLSFGPRD
ncbi:MAG: STAS domain-containing protein [Phycisphaerales bacterium]|jgi:anti-anti-sigma factor|nr:STAS domain-containing protein [Phycisphaerales bacterium]MDP6890826.1 STAS domain-containing protein [Phycisphaerales bacterium]